MNILFINNYPFNPIIGGVERVTDVIAKYLKKQGNKIIYFYGNNSYDPSYMNYDFPAISYSLPKNANSPYDAKDLTFYQAILEKEQIDVIVNQKPFLKKYRLFNKSQGRSVISVVHSHPMLSYYVIRKEILFSVSLFSLKGFFANVFALFFPIVLKRITLNKIRVSYKEIVDSSSKVIFLSSRYLSLVHKKFGIPFKKMDAISNPLPFKRIDTKPQKQNIILYVGRMSIYDKNPLAFLKIWKKIYKKNIFWKAIMVGNGPDVDIIKKYIKRNKLERIDLFDATSDLEPFYQKADIVCLTSYQEGFGMTLIEGMSYYCIPCSFNNSEAIYDIIGDGVSGWIIPNNNIDYYVERIQELINSSEKRNFFSEKSYKKSLSFSIDIIGKKWEELLYHSLNKTF